MQRLIIALLGLGIIAAVPMLLISSATTSILILVVNSLVILCSMIWILVGAPRMSQKFVTSSRRPTKDAK